MSWTAPEGCPEHLKSVVEELVNALPPAWLELPVIGEVFESFEECERRLHGYSLSKGFDIVKTGGGNRKSPARRWCCVHHGVETRNYRGLEENVERNAEGVIRTVRQRQATNVAQLDCKWSVRCSFKPFERGEEAKGYILTVLHSDEAFNEGHSHAYHPNPLSFTGHRKRTAEYKSLISVARQHRRAVIPYSASCRVLNSEDYSMILSSKEYYNLMRSQKVNLNNEKTIEGLLLCLDTGNFDYRTDVDYEIDKNDQPISGELLQIVFIYH